MVADTKHAVTLRTKAGNGILIHVGLDTVQLGGKYFDVHVKEGQELKRETASWMWILKKSPGKGMTPLYV